MLFEDLRLKPKFYLAVGDLKFILYHKPIFPNPLKE